MPVYKDKNGTYYFIVRIRKPGGGTRQVKRRGFASRPEARAAEAEVIFNADQYDEENPTFKYVVEEYKKWYKKRRKTTSYLKLDSVTKNNLLPVFGKKKINDIRNRDITKLHNDLIDKYSVSHAKKIHGILSAIFNYAIRQEYTTNNPARTVGNIDLKEEKKMDYWTLDEFKQFMTVVDDDLYYTLFLTLYYSGLRRGELLALTWKDIDFDNKAININKTFTNEEVTDPKTESSIRKLVMPGFVMTKLAALKLKTKPKTDYVVFGEVYDVISKGTLNRRYSEYVDKSGLSRIRLHDFRHSHASYLINTGAIPAVVAKRLGHSDIATTLNTYSHLYPSTEKDIIDKMENDFKTSKVHNLNK